VGKKNYYPLRIPSVVTLGELCLPVEKEPTHTTILDWELRDLVSRYSLLYWYQVFLANPLSPSWG
jgi:hypothetical protein